MKGEPVERLEKGWGGEIVRLHRSAFPQEAVELTILGCEGVSDYFESLLAFPEVQAEHLFLGAAGDGRLIGYAHFRRLPESWHLNYVVVAPERAGTGIGTVLLDGWADEARRRERFKLSLDVESGNTLALEWYCRRGFREIARKWTCRRPLWTSDDGSGFRIELVGWDAAEAWQTSYGFSSFGLCCEGKTWALGRLGEGFFRAFERLPSWLEPVLARLCPGRELLTILDTPAYEGAGQLVSESVHMEMDLDR